MERGDGKRAAEGDKSSGTPRRKRGYGCVREAPAR